MDNFDPYSVLLAIATNIPVLLKAGLCSRVTNMFKQRRILMSVRLLV